MIDEDSSPIVTDVDRSVAVIRFNRLSARNPLSLKTLRELKHTTAAFFLRHDIQAVILTGAGDVFASGANIRELAQLDEAAALEFSKFGQDLFQTIADARPLTIAAVNGYCMGGALDLALACDIRVASTSAVFAHPGARLGIITGWGGTQRLARIVGRANALEFMLTARRFTATDALRIKLITGIADPVVDYALKLAGHKKEGGRISATFTSINLQP
jgi:enoyl-CoA hydratase